jgi:UDP-N-acetylmuramyl tripeptide synthase
VILLAGKGHETYEINRTGRHPFDEKEIVAQIAVQLLANRREKQKND